MNYTVYIIACALILPMFIYSMVVSARVKTTFNKYANMGTKSGLTASQVARMILDKEGLSTVQIGRVGGNLTDNYDPRVNTVFLSDSVYNSTSVSAIGVAAHECGHAIQHDVGYVPLKIRSALVPVVNFGSRLSLPILLIGLLLDLFISSNFGFLIMVIGVILYGSSTVFAFITLPCEFNASRRAKNLMSEGILDREEVSASTEVLRSAAMTYVASFAMSLLMLIRIIFMFLGNRGRSRK